MPRIAKADSEFSLSPSAAKLRLLKKLRCTLRYEKVAWESGATLVAGVDEVGRGSLFGPVVAAAVILDRGYRIRGLRDSKLLLPGAPRTAGACAFANTPLPGPWLPWMRRASIRSTSITRRGSPCAKP